MDFKVFTFTMFFDVDCKPEDRQERYVVAQTEDEAIKKFHSYLERQAADGFEKPTSYSHYPTVELVNVIV